MFTITIFYNIYVLNFLIFYILKATYTVIRFKLLYYSLIFITIMIYNNINLDFI